MRHTDMYPLYRIGFYANPLVWFLAIFALALLCLAVVALLALLELIVVTSPWVIACVWLRQVWTESTSAGKAVTVPVQEPEVPALPEPVALPTPAVAFATVKDEAAPPPVKKRAKPSRARKPRAKKASLSGK